METRDDEKIKIMQLELRVSATEKFIEQISKDMHELKSVLVPLVTQFKAHLDWEERQVSSWKGMESRINSQESSATIAKLKEEQNEKDIKELENSIKSINDDVSELKKVVYKAIGALSLVAVLIPVILKFI